jgi:EAL domain-containing protein (putative c-di-GMP-specific phosphodiesterase class I)
MLCEIDALYYFARDPKYSEEFVQIRAQYLRRYEVNPNELSHGVQHMLEKTGAMTNLLQSLHALGQRTLVSKLAARYGLMDHLQYILKN